MLASVFHKEVIEYWRMSSAYAATRYDRLNWTASKLHMLHPEVPKFSFYKYISGTV